MPALEIRVEERVIVTESVSEAAEIIKRVIENWLDNCATTALTITISRQLENKSPPPLGINVTESIVTRERLR